MIRVLVAEDEKPIAKHIAKIIHSVNAEFEVVAIAYNGKEAVELLQSDSFDVAFLDINMPIMSGLDVLSFIREQRLSTFGVILTGEQQFEYARRAIRDNTVDYLLKPLDKSVLSHLLDKLQSMVRKANFEKNIFSRNRVDERFFYNEDGGDADSYYGLCYIGNNSLGEIEQEQEQLIDEVLLALNNNIDSEFNPYDVCITQGKFHNEYSIFIKNEVEHYRERIERLFLDFEYPLPLFVLCSENTVPTDQMQNLYYKFKKISAEQIRFDTTLILFEDNIAAYISGNIERFNEITLSSTQKEIVAVLEQAILHFDGNRKDFEKMIKRFFLSLSQKVCTDVNYFDIEPELTYAYDSCYDRKTLMGQLLIIIDSFFFTDTNPEGGMSSLAKTLKDYLEQNYQHALSNRQIEEKMGYSNYYLRKMFKEQYNILPNEYLQQLRMDSAKRLLLQGVPVKNVALQVGYEDPLYFSKVFKKHTKCSPSDYKNAT